MTNKEHLKILKQGVKPWNRWRKENPKITPDLSGADLSGAHLDNALVARTDFGDIDLSLVKGLNRVEHIGPSSIGIDTVYKSRGKIPEAFLRGAGVPEDL